MILVFQHTAHEHPAALGKALRAAGSLHRVVRLDLGEPVPSLSGVSGIVSLGGPMSANDESGHPWIRDELRALEEALARGLPIAGLCLGGQLLARALGARVERNLLPEIGWHPVRLSAAGEADPLLSGWASPRLAFHWHYDKFELPRGAERLADSEGCERQAYRVGRNAYGFQFHPEADGELVGEWLSTVGTERELRDAARASPWVQSPADIRARSETAASSSQELCARIVTTLFARDV